MDKWLMLVGILVLIGAGVAWWKFGQIDEKLSRLHRYYQTLQLQARHGVIVDDESLREITIRPLPPRESESELTDNDQETLGEEEAK